nr:hypothetical protein [Tanacetum cinerariifolium]
MPSPNTKTPYIKPPTENQILGFIKTLGYDKDPKAKKAKSESKSAKEPEEQNVSPIKSERGKWYMHSGDYEEKASKMFKKDIVPRKTNSYGEWGQKLKGLVVEDLTVQSLSDLQKGSKASRLESLRDYVSVVAGTDDMDKGTELMKEKVSQEHVSKEEVPLNNSIGKQSDNLVEMPKEAVE